MHRIDWLDLLWAKAVLYNGPGADHSLKLSQPNFCYKLPISRSSFVRKEHDRLVRSAKSRDRLGTFKIVKGFHFSAVITSTNAMYPECTTNSI
jgi:hypothetical protein